MIITDHTTSSRGEDPEDSKPKEGDKLNMEKFNALQSPVIAKMIGGGEWQIETLCVQTGLMRLDVCGRVDREDFIMIDALIDANGDEHDPDDFWLE